MYCMVRLRNAKCLYHVPSQYLPIKLPGHKGHTLNCNLATTCMLSSLIKRNSVLMAE